MIETLLSIHLNKDFNFLVSQEICKNINAILSNKRSELALNLLNKIGELIVTSEDFQLLIDNTPIDYEAEFGILQVDNVLSEAVNIWKTEYELDFQPFSTKRNGKIVGFLKFKAINSNFERVLDLKYASYISNYNQVEWLKWVLLEGDKTIDDFGIDYDIDISERYRSRTKRALMRPGGHWLVPEPFRGDNVDNNLVTRSLRNFNTEFSKIIESVIF